MCIYAYTPIYNCTYKVRVNKLVFTTYMSFEQKEICIYPIYAQSWRFYFGGGVTEMLKVWGLQESMLPQEDLEVVPLWEWGSGIYFYYG